MGFKRSYGSDIVRTSHLPVNSRIYQITTDNAYIDVPVGPIDGGLAITNTNMTYNDHQIYIHAIGVINGTFSTHLIYSSSNSDDGISLSQVDNNTVRLTCKKSVGTNVRTLLILSKHILIVMLLAIVQVLLV